MGSVLQQMQQMQQTQEDTKREVRVTSSMLSGASGGRSIAEELEGRDAAQLEAQMGIAKSVEERMDQFSKQVRKDITAVEKVLRQVQDESVSDVRDLRTEV